MKTTMLSFLYFALTVLMSVLLVFTKAYAPHPGSDLPQRAYVPAQYRHILEAIGNLPNHPELPKEKSNYYIIVNWH